MLDLAVGVASALALHEPHWPERRLALPARPFPNSVSNTPRHKIRYYGLAGNHIQRSGGGLNHPLGTAFGSALTG